MRERGREREKERERDVRKFHLSNARKGKGEGESANIANKDTFYRIQAQGRNSYSLSNICVNIVSSGPQLSVLANWHLSFAMHFTSDSRTEAIFVEHSGKWDNGCRGRKGIMGCSPFLILI